MDDEYKQYKENYNDFKEQYSTKELISLLDENNLLDKLYSEANNIKKEYLYSSDMHGIKHNQRVLFHAFIICFMEHIVGDNYRIIMDACKYHDVGRIDDEEDDMHGIRSSQIIANQIMVKDDFYKSDNNLGYLRAIVEIHSHSDSINKLYFDKYCLDNYSRYVKLYSILKDSDGLDRVRLYRNFPGVLWLDPKYLRTVTSKKLIKCAHELNYLTK